VIAYQVVFVTILLHRQTTRGLPFTRGWAAFIGAVNLAIAIAAIAGLVWGSVGAYEWLLLLMLVRPMIAFVTVLTSFERPTTGISGD
jgi:hypothetical protein